MRCEINNALSERILLLADDLVLEGPEAGKPYLYHPTGGDRFENVFQYHFADKRTLDLPTLFHPVVHLRPADIARLVRIEPQGKLEIDILWSQPTARRGLSPGHWIAQASLVYITQQEVSQLLRAGTVPTDCRDALAESLPQVGSKALLRLNATSKAGERRWFYDGCSDRISERFHHVQSNTVAIEIATVR